MTTAATIAACRAIIQRRLDDATQERAFHLARGPRLGNVEALAASLKAKWAKSALAEIDALAQRTSR